MKFSLEGLMIILFFLGCAFCLTAMYLLLHIQDGQNRLDKRMNTVSAVIQNDGVVRELPKIVSQPNRGFIVPPPPDLGSLLKLN